MAAAAAAIAAPHTPGGPLPELNSPQDRPVVFPIAARFTEVCEAAYDCGNYLCAKVAPRATYEGIREFTERRTAAGMITVTNE
eukprot:1888077-Pyramimonas_sp.AAC.1